MRAMIVINCHSMHPLIATPLRSTSAGGGVVAVLSAETEEGSLAQGVGALCNAVRE